MNPEKLLFAGFSYDKIGPYFIFDNIETHFRQKMYFDSKIMTIENTEIRYCVGTYDLSTFATSPCKKNVELDKQHKGNHCDVCQFEIGFNPAFYNSKTISPQQARYNASPHVVYMAYFSPNHIKVGIASKRRHSIRMLEQGARAAIVLAEFSNAQQARQLEVQLCSNENILENLSSDIKYKLLTDKEYNFNSASEYLLKAVNNYYNKIPIGNVIDLQKYYFYGKSNQEKIRRIDIKKETSISGKLIGMIGDFVIFSQPDVSNNYLFAISVKKYVSHMVNIYHEEIKTKYVIEPKQVTFWDIE